MRHYKYFENVEKNAYYTDTRCQFCGSESNCLEGVFFEKENIFSICLDCFEKKMVSVEIPDYIKTRVRNNAYEKITDLKYTPPVPWIQNNDWPVCCDDFMVYIGEWQQNDFNRYAGDESGEGIKALEELIDSEIAQQVESYKNLWEEIGNEAGAFAFRCLCCGRIKVIVQEY